VVQGNLDSKSAAGWAAIATISSRLVSMLLVGGCGYEEAQFRIRTAVEAAISRVFKAVVCAAGPTAQIFAELWNFSIAETVLDLQSPS